MRSDLIVSGGWIHALCFHQKTQKLRACFYRLHIGGGPSYRLPGVISGEVLENSDVTMTVTTFISGMIGANSDVSMVVPGTEVLKLLESANFQSERDVYVNSQPAGAPK